MLKGIQGQNPTFLADLSRTQNRIALANRQITSGYRVNQASDDPTALGSILKYQSQIDHLTQTQTNLAVSKSENTTADGALQTASSILDQLISIAAEGGSDTSNPETRALLGEQVKQLTEQLVMAANTTVNGRYVFGGDAAGVMPYTSAWTSLGSAISNSTAGATALLDDGNGSTTTAGMTAASIFDSGSNSIFRGAYNLGIALAANNTVGVQTAADSLRTASKYLTQVSASYGLRENWIQQASDTASSQIISLQQQLAGVRETDLPAAISELTANQTALQAAIAAHASLSTKSLFDYLG